MEEIVHQAEQLEKEYDWVGAAGSYEKALKLLPQDDFSRIGEVHERLGNAHFRFAFQAESKDEFKERLRQSVAAYEKAIGSYGRSENSLKTAKTLRCNAMIAYAGYWFAPQAQEKKKMIDECWRLTKDALKAFMATGENCEYGRTYKQLSSSIVFGFCLGWDFQAQEKLMKEAVEHGEQTIKSLSTEYKRELAEAYAKTAFFSGVFDYYFLETAERQKALQKIQEYWQKAKELSEDVTLFEFLYPIFGPQFLLWGDGTEEAFTNLNKALEYGRKTKDKFIIGCTLDWLVYHNNWQPSPKYDEDPEARSAFAKTFLQFAEDAKQQYAPISFISPRGDALWIETIGADYDSMLGYYETDLRKKRILYEKAREARSEGLKRAEGSGSPHVTIFANHMLGAILVRLADLESSSEEKKRLLEEALKHKQESVRITEKVEPLLLWNVGIMREALAAVKYGLADLAEDSETKKRMLQEAILDMENGLKLSFEDARAFEKQFPAAPWALGWDQHQIGIWLKHLYELTSNKEHLRKAAKALVEAAEIYQKVDAKNRVAECQWKAAQAYDDLGEYLKAAEYFDLASDNYKRVSERIIQIKDLYKEHSCYMMAWSEIEKARYHHERQEYGLAKEHFEKAAHLHKSLKKWGYLEGNYSAWAQVENAEELSRKEQSEEAIEAFEQASKLFCETKKSVQAQLIKIEDKDEKQMADNMTKASDLRYEYCEGRIAIEEAKILDRTGDHFASSGKYGSAAEIFEKIAQTLESEQERKEFKSLASLSLAWQKMMLGDAKASPESYLEASVLFEQASKDSNSEVTGLLALGHSRFCKALEMGTRFADSGNMALQTVATQNLEIAAKYYVKAGFQSASEYAKATGLLFEAYVHMDTAKEEKDPERKTKLYLIAEKILQTSAGSFMKAEHPEKREQVLRLLEKVRDERELALSIAEVLHTPSIVSTTASFSAPTPTSEEAVGSERFEHADVQANLIVRQKELKVGEDLKVEIELVNAGRGPAVLIKLSGIIPEGFELVDKPEIYRVEDSYLNMKGKRLDALKPEEVKITLKPKSQGVFQLKPRISYLDENSKYRYYDTETVSVVVKELGIKGWLKGER